MLLAPFVPLGFAVGRLCLLHVDRLGLSCNIRRLCCNHGWLHILHLRLGCDVCDLLHGLGLGSNNVLRLLLCRNSILWLLLRCNDVLWLLLWLCGYYVLWLLLGSCHDSAGDRSRQWHGQGHRDGYWDGHGNRDWDRDWDGHGLRCRLRCWSPCVVSDVDVDVFGEKFFVVFLVSSGKGSGYCKKQERW